MSSLLHLNTFRASLSRVKAVIPAPLPRLSFLLSPVLEFLPFLNFTAMKYPHFNMLKYLHFNKMKYPMLYLDKVKF